MNFSTQLTTVALSLIICMISLALAGGDKSAKTTVITLAGGGEKQGGGYPVSVSCVRRGEARAAPQGWSMRADKLLTWARKQLECEQIPIPIPVCAGKMHGTYSGGHHGGYHGGYGAQARMGWRR